MPTIYYAYYTPISDSISAISSQEHNLGHTLLLQGLQDLFQLSFSPEELEQALKTDANGKPYLPDHPEICFNITHCDQLAACVFHDRPIGIDAEFPGYYPDVLVDRALSESEKDFLQSHNADLSENREWFYRLCKEPKRIGRMMKLPKFLFAAIGCKLRGKKHHGEG